MQLSQRASVVRLIADVRKKLNEEQLEIGDIFENCFKSTLETTVKRQPDGTTFVITGDIPAMWLRDSACQVRPYLVLAGEDAEIAAMILGVIRREVQCILIDPYANAFNESANGNCWDHDLTEMRPEIWERKFEVDSLCFPIQLAWLYWKNTGRTDCFDEDFQRAANRILETFETERNHEQNSRYTFQRRNCIYTDTLSRDGKGALVKPDTGLIWSGFRPSDDACVYGYLIPSNMFACVVLGYLEKIASEIYKDQIFAERAGRFSRELRAAIEREAIVPGGGKQEPFYAYEVDGYGQYLVMDDANVPSLLSAPYLGYCSREDRMWQNTKEAVLSDRNPYFYSGSFTKGIGSPHTPVRYIWHISLGMQGLVAETREEKRRVLLEMASLDGGTGCMHEGICVDNPEEYTRPWFSWANAIFTELVLDYCGYPVRTETKGQVSM